MKVILLQDIRNVGKKNEVKNVSDGFARNYLIARGLAKIATEGEVKKIAEDTAAKNAALAVKKLELEKVLAKIKETKIEIPIKVGDKGEVFGSVTAKDVEKALEKAGYETKGVRFEKSLRTIGNHEAEINLGLDVKGKITFSVVKAEK